MQRSSPHLWAAHIRAVSIDVWFGGLRDGLCRLPVGSSMLLLRCCFWLRRSRCRSHRGTPSVKSRLGASPRWHHTRVVVVLQALDMDRNCMLHLGNLHVPPWWPHHQG